LNDNKFRACIFLNTFKALESNTDRLLKIFAGFHKLRAKLCMDSDYNLSAGLELAVNERETLSALGEEMAHAETIVIRKTRTWSSSSMNFRTSKKIQWPRRRRRCKSLIFAGLL
jgi:hypothetical protein